MGHVRLQLCDYQFKNHMFESNMSGCDMLLGVEYLQTLVIVIMDFKELYLSFTKESHNTPSKSLQSGYSKIIISHHMEKLLKKGYCGIISQLNAIQVLDIPTPYIHPNLKMVLNKHH